MEERIVAYPDAASEALADALASAVGVARVRVAMRHFPDGESHVRALDPVDGAHVVVVCSLHRPNARFVPLAMLTHTLRDLGAARVSLIAPYLSYMRQDERFHPGEGITSHYFATMLSATFDGLMTVDPHLHRHHDLGPLFTIPAGVVSAASCVAGWLRDAVARPLIVGPDEESGQWARPVAEALGAPVVVLEKERRGDRDVTVSTHDTLDDYPEHTPVIVDDIISTGRTMIEAVRRVREAGLPAPLCVGVHAVCADADVEVALREAGAARMVTCDTIPHTSNAISTLPALVEAFQALVAQDHP